MPLDNIFAPYIQRPVNPLDVTNALMQRDATIQQNQLATLQFQKAQRAAEEEQGVAEVFKQAGADPAAIRQGLVARGYVKPYQDFEESQAKLAKEKAAAGASEALAGQHRAETAAKVFANARDLLPMIKSPDQFRQWVDGLYAHPATRDLVTQVFGDPAAIKANVPADPAEFGTFLTKNAVGLARFMEDQTRRRGQDVQRQTSIETNAATNATSRANNAATVAATVRGQNLADARAGQQLQAPRYEQTDAGLVMLPGKVAPGQQVTGTPVLGADGQPLGKALRPIPAGINTAIIANSQASKQLDRALTLVGGKNIGDPSKGGMQGDADATGWKGYAPQPLLNRWDSKGVATRAEIADIGSLKIHDRSGAAVTVSETPRLVPFIPLAADDHATVVKKLRRLKLEIDNESTAMRDTYSKEQGYTPSPVLNAPKRVKFGDLN